MDSLTWFMGSRQKHGQTHHLWKRTQWPVILFLHLSICMDNSRGEKTVLGWGIVRDLILLIPWSVLMVMINERVEQSKASMMRTAIRGIKLINYGQVQPTVQPCSTNQTGTLASPLSQSAALWTEHDWTALSLHCLYYSTDFGQPYGDIGLPRWLSGKRLCLQCWRHRKHGFRSWVGKVPWRRKWQLTPVFLPGKSHGQRSLVGYRPCSHKESDTT